MPARKYHTEEQRMAARREAHRKWRAANPEKVKAAGKNRRPEDSKSVQARVLQWRKDNPEKWAAYHREYERARRAEHPEKAKEAVKKSTRKRLIERPEEWKACRAKTRAETNARAREAKRLAQLQAIANPEGV